MSVIVEILVGVAFRILEKLPEWVVGKFLDRIGQKPTLLTSPPSEWDGPYPPTCGEKGIDLAQQRLLVSIAFGTYFAGLLEREHGYVPLKGQIECPAVQGLESWEPIQRIFWMLQHPEGPHLLVIAADGGMGKSTLAARIVRCLFEKKAVDVILGDSAKTQCADPVTGELIRLEPGYYDVATFYERMCEQLGLPPSRDRWVLVAIRDRLEGRRAVILVDNLETVARGDELLRSLRTITTRDVRAIVTTRVVKGLRDLTSDRMIVHLRPLENLVTVQQFLRWHIHQYRSEYPGLQSLEQDLDDKRRIRRLIERTGGVPLLIQLVFSDVARFSWKYLDELPHLFGDDLLSFLYQARWEELGALGTEGLMARDLLRWVAGEQYRGKKVTFERLAQWARGKQREQMLTDSLRLLYERFLIINHDPTRGNFTIFPSLAEFVQRQGRTGEVKP